MTEYRGVPIPEGFDGAPSGYLAVWKRGVDDALDTQKNQAADARAKVEAAVRKEMRNIHATEQQ